MTQLTCFKAYDIRGELGEELNEDIAYRIGRAYGEFLKPGKIVVGGDVRLTSESLKLALARGLMDAGTDVLDIGLSGTEEIYFATFHLGVDGGIEVTASHNPMNYNGMKLVRENAKPISGDTGLRDIQRLAEENQFPPVDPARRGTLRDRAGGHTAHAGGGLQRDVVAGCELDPALSADDASGYGADTCRSLAPGPGVNFGGGRDDIVVIVIGPVDVSRQATASGFGRPGADNPIDAPGKLRVIGCRGVEDDGACRVTDE